MTSLKAVTEFMQVWQTLISAIAIIVTISYYFGENGEKVAGLKDDVTVIHASIETLDGRVTVLETDNAAHKANYSHIMKAVDEIKKLIRGEK